MDYEIYKGEKNKSFIVFTNLKLTKEQMVYEANKHFHYKSSDLTCEPGYITKDDELFLSNTYKKGTTTVWVVHRK